MRILLVTQNYFPFVGGVEVHVRQVAHAFVDAGHRVRVAAVNFRPNTLPPRLAVLHGSLLASRFASYADGDVSVTALAPSACDRLRLAPAAVRAIPRLQRYAYHGLSRFAYRFAFRPVFGPRLRALAADADVVHCFAFGELGWAAQAAARSARLPFVVTPFVHPSQWGDGPDDIRFYARSDAVIGLVETDRQYLASIGVPTERLHTIGVSPDLPPQSDPDGFRKKHGLGKAPLVLYVGRMMPQKGAAAVLAAAPAVLERAPDARFVFIGPASPVEAAKFAGLDPRVMYLGKVSAQEKADAIAACDVFCMPSMSEILPTVYLEAWSCGKPVVGGRAHGLPELVEGNQAGIAVSQAEAEVARAILQLLADRDLRDRLGSAGRKLVETQYSVDAVTRRLLSLYEHLSAGAEGVPDPACLR